MKNICLLILIFFTTSDRNIAQVEYAPLQLGNVWVYQIVGANRSRVEIIDSAVIIDSIKYFGYAFAYQTNISGLIRLRSDGYYVSKQDSAFPEPLNEWRYYKKNANVGDIWQVNYGGAAPVTYFVTDSIPAYIFDTVVTAKIVREDFGISDPWDYTWTKEFGKLAKFGWWGETHYYLLGCVINGKVYGDTTLVTDVNDFITDFSFNLYQNFPNPFNPKTIIKFRIEDFGMVSLKVFDVLGNVVAYLIDKEMPAGEYDFEFNAATLPSGIYFYSLRAGNKIITKKMVFLR